MQKTLGAQLTSGTTAAATLNNVTGIQNLPGVFVIDRINSAGVETASAREVISFTATSGSTVTGLTRGLAGTSDQDHEVGAIVEFSPDVIWAQSVYDALTATVVASTGVLDTTKVVSPSDTQTLFNKMISGATLSSPTFVGFSTIASLSLVSPLIGVGSDAIGDMYYRKSGGGLARLALGTSGQVLTANASLPQWSSSMTDGWISSLDTWVYASASTYTISGVDRTSVYTKGTRLKFTQTSEKYAVVVSSSFSTDTTVTIAVNSDYTIANAAITSPNYSYDSNPQGYPGWFTYTPTYAGFSSNPTYVAKYSIFGNTCICQHTVSSDGTSNATTKTITLPVAAGVNQEAGVFIWGKDNGSYHSVPGHYKFTSGNATVNVYKSFPQGAWTNSGACNWSVPAFAYEF